MTDVDDHIWIESGRAVPGGPLICRITWNEAQWMAPVACVSAAAADLFTAATYAELTEQVLGMGMPGEEVAALLSRMLFPALRSRKHVYYTGGNGIMLGCDDVFGIAPGGSTSQREGVVVVQRGSEVAHLEPAQARAMAVGFFEAADACTSDTLFEAVLRESGLLDPERIALMFELALAARRDD